MARKASTTRKQAAVVPADHDEVPRLVRLAATAIGDRVKQQFAALDADLGQVRSIINSATENLSGTFAGLQTEAAGQQQILRDLVDELVATVEGPEHEQQTVGIQRLSRETDDIVRRFVEVFRAMHDASGQISHKFGRILGQFEDAVSKLNDPGERSLERHFSAVRSALDAVATPGVVQGPGSLDFEVRALLKRVQAFCDRVHEQTARMEVAIAQVNEVVDSIPRPDLESVEASRQAINGIWKQMRELNDRVVEKSTNVTQVSERIREHVYTGVVSLQFEDITGQLIEHVRRRNAAVEEAFGRLADALGHCADVTAMEAVLRHLDTDLDQRFEGLSHKAVNQTTVDTGSIDLF